MILNIPNILTDILPNTGIGGGLDFENIEEINKEDDSEKDNSFVYLIILLVALSIAGYFLIKK